MSYFAYAGFFLKEPEGITWSDEAEDATYYYEFKKDGTFYVNIGSVEIKSTYQKTKSEDGNTIIVGTDIGSFMQKCMSSIFGNDSKTEKIGKPMENVKNHEKPWVFSAQSL